jgi:branched-chain amino acid transport system permease protein
MMDLSIGIYLIQATQGLVYGMLLFLIASGLTLVLGMMGVLNVAHAVFYMLGAYFAYSLTLYLGSFWLSLLISPLIVGTLSILIERFLIRKTYKGGHHQQLLLTFGLFFILGELVRVIWGTVPLDVPTPELFVGSIPLMGMIYPTYRLFILGFSFLVLLIIALVLSRTRIGIIIRAAVSDAEMVDVLGVNTPVFFTGVFGGGAVLAALAGVIAAPFLSVYSGMGLDALLDCFVVIVVGGFGSLLGAFIASMMIGQLHSFGILWVPKLAIVFQFLLMAVVLIIRPTGLFGEKE